MSLSKKNVKSFLAVVLVLAMVLAFMPALSSGMNAQAVSHNFGGKRVGCWWWSSSDINESSMAGKAGATEYLQCMKDCGVNEIYLSCFGLMNTQGNRSKIHTFVEKAKSYGCRVAVLYGEWDDFNTNNAKNFDLLVGYMKAYKSEWPADQLYGIHMDIEPGNYNATTLQSYTDKFIARVQAARQQGVYIEVDVNCGWNNQGGTSTTLNGVTGIYNILAKNFDAVFAMSYRNTMKGTDTITTFAAPVVTACKANGCPVYLGVETDSGTGILPKSTFAGKSKEAMFEVMDQVMANLATQGLVDYGMAIHQNKSLLALQDTTPTTEPPSEGNCIWSGDINMDITTRNTVGIIKVDSLTEAIRNDIAAYGPATKYVAVSDNSSYVSGKSGYCLFGFYQDANAAKGLEYVESWGTAEKGDELVYCSWEASNTKQGLSKFGSDINFCVFSDGSDDVCHIGNLKLYAYHGSVVPTTRTPSATTASTTKMTIPTTMPTTASSRVVEILYGDANDDGEINMKDVLTVRKEVAQLDVDYINMKTADANGDGSVNMKDVLAIRKYIAQLVDKLGPGV